MGELESQEHKDDQPPAVAILLCTYNGQPYLAEQLDSIAAQSYANWKLWVSDDGSKDDTLSILENYQEQWQLDRLKIISGPAKGFARNFLSLTCRSEIEADYYAYSDQDDVWEHDKLMRAVAWLKTIPEDMPALYCGRTRLVDKKNNEVGLSPLFTKPPSFANALMQNIAGGNTMVFNKVARNILCEAGETFPVSIHDWWVYIVVTGCGGHVFYDTSPTLRYRQHEMNMIGMNAGFSARFGRVLKLWKGHFSNFTDQNIASISRIKHRLTPKNREILEKFSKARQMSLFPRLVQFKRIGIYRQTLLGNLGLFAAIILNKI